MRKNELSEDENQQRADTSRQCWEIWNSYIVQQAVDLKTFQRSKRLHAGIDHYDGGWVFVLVNMGRELGLAR